MAKQLNVDLTFKANTAQAKQSIMELQSALSKITMSGSAIGVDSSKMKEASAAAKELSIHLNNAFNAQTGKLDLSRLDKSLKTSSTNVTELSSKLLNAGTQGQQAFVKLAQTIAAADRPIVTLNSKLNEMFTTLKNTARWQLSSSILHGFMSAYQQAMGYVKELNKSLTDIRIVTGKSIEDMTRFANEANRAAKALSTTTNEYAQASLIFYQQGLNESEVAKRTEVTIKMANAAGQTAQVVSDQLTAVWNNFYDGSKSLEYYADVMTALGAATASSTDEIAGGLEKFAAIADTIGLSYEYAASALATITANTRQSEEVVGTALKTIFARIQGLNLGETLDDGTTLNKYSEALQKVGISIFDQGGELKDMDKILDEMGEKWQTLNKAQQTALAQTVAGTRQYTQLVALMDNWDSGDSDSMQANLTTSYNAEGTLQDQADIYAESWEAARDRVKASLETIYGQLLDDEFFIDISNGFASLLDSVSAFIDGIGGVKTILGTIFTFFLSSVSTKIEPALQQLKQNFEIVFTGSSKSAKKMAEEMQAASRAVLNDPKNNLSQGDRYALESATQMNAAKNKMFDVEKNLSPLEKQQYEMELQILEIEQKNISALIEQNEKKKEAVSLAEKEVQLAKDKLSKATSVFDEGKAIDIAASTRESEEAGLKKQFDKAKANYQQNGSGKNLAALNEAKKALFEHMDATEQARSSFEQFIGVAKQAYEAEMELTNGNIQASKSAVAVGDVFNDYAADLTNLSTSLTSGNANLKETKAQLNNLESQLNMATGGVLDFSEEFANMQIAANGKQLASQIDKFVEKLKESKIPAKHLEKILNKLGQGKYTKALSNGYKDVAKKTEEASNAAEDYKKSITNLKKAQDELNKKFDAFNPQHKAKALESFAKSGAGLGKLASSITMIRSAFVALGNEDLSFGEKLTTVTMSLTMALPNLSSGLKDLRSGFSGLNEVFGLTASVQKMAGMAMLQNASYTDLLTGKITAQQVAQRTGLSLDQAEVLINQAKAKQMLQEAVAHGTLGDAKMKEILAERLGCTAKQAGIIVSKMKAGTSFEEAAAEAGVTLVKTKGIVATIASTIAKKAEDVADKTHTTTIWGKVAAYIAAQAAAWPVLVVTLLIVAAITALAAVIAIAVTAIKAMIAAYNADEIAAQKAEQSAKALAEAYGEAKQAYEDMIAAMDEYESAREALDSLTEGTQEYQEALEKANRAALELINNNPDLFKEGDYHWENGELIIDENAMESARQVAAGRESQAYAAMQMGQAEAKEARNVADETALRRELVKDSTTGSDYLAGALTGAFSTAAFGTILATAIGGPIGLAIGGALMGTGALTKGALGGAAMTGSLESKKLKDSEALDKTIAQLQKDNSFLDSGAENIKATLNIDDDDIINALIENKDALLELSEAQEAQTLQEKLSAQQSANEILQNSQFSDMSDEMTYMGGAVFQEATDKAYDTLLGNMNSKGGLKAGADAYFESQGISAKDGFKVEKYDAKNGTVSYSYLDESGQRQELEVTAEQIAMTQAVIVAQEQLLASCEAMEDTFNALDADIKDASSSTALLSEGMKAFLTSGDTSQLTKEQYDAMAGMDANAMKDYLASIGINDSNIQSYGYDNMDAMVNDMDLTSTGDKWAEFQNITAHQGTEDLTLNQAENINNALEDIADFFGEEVGDKMLDLSATMADSLDEAAQDDFWEQLSNISDYADADQWDGFLDAMKESGELTEDQEKALENYVDTAKLASRATKDLDFDEMAKSVGNLRDIMNNISEGQREISDEEFATLEAQGIDTSKFAKTIDGYRYLGDSADLVADISEGITNQFKDAEQNFANIAATAAQASQNLINAEAALEAAKAASDAARTSAEEGATNQLSNTQKLSIIMSQIVNNVVSKIKSAWDWICGIMMDIYDFFARTFNTIGQGITDIWNGFLQIIEEIVNGVVGGIVDLLEKIPGVDINWEDISFDKASFDGMKTAEEIEAEEAARKAEEDARKAEEKLIAATQELADAIPDITKSIESSADYLSEAELQKGYEEAESQYGAASAGYSGAVKQYGKDSTQAQYYEQLMAYYEAQMEAYEKALDSKAWGEAISEGIDTKEMESYIDLLEQANPEMRDLYKTTEEYEKALLQVATANKKMEKGVKSLSSNWDKWNDIMSDSEASAEDISTILPDVNEAVQDVLNLDTTEFAMLPPDFAQKHWDLIQDVVNGVEGSVDTLRNMAGQEILMQIDGVVDPNGNIDTQFLALHEKIAQFDQSQFTVGVAVDNAEFIAACNDIIQQAGMTAAQAQAYFASMGYDVELEEKPPVEQPVSETQQYWVPPTYSSKPMPYGVGSEFAAVTMDSPGYWESSSSTATVTQPPVYAVKTITPNGSYGGGVGVNTTAPKTSTNNGSGGGGGGSQPKKAAPSKKTDIVDRYKEIDDKLDDQARHMDKASKAADRLWGKARIDAMRNVNKALADNITLLKQKKTEAELNLKRDEITLQDALKQNANTSATFDDAGNISNYEEIMTQLYNELRAAEDIAGSEWDEAEQEKIDGIQERIDKVKEAIEQYDETKELLQDLDQEIMDAIYEWQDNNYEILNVELETKIEISDANLELIDYYMNKLEDDLYATAEAYAYLGQQTELYTQRLADQQSYIEQLEADYYAGKISMEDYKEGLQNAQSATIENLEALEDLKQQMQDYYGNVLSMAMDEIAVYTDQMEHLTSVLDHYSNIQEIIGKQTDYETKGTILQGKADSLRNELDVQRELYNMYNAEAEKWAQEMANAVEGSVEYETYKKNWEAAQEAANEAQEAMLSKTEEWAEAMRAVIENEMAKAAKSLEQSLTGGTSFDELLTSMERRQSLQEEYLTTTNQIYETNTLMRKAQQEIDKTSNTAAKRRLSNFIKETSELQNQTKLSQYELDIQQAKYDLLLAEIALEEAQNAKSTVRLQRDSEGNFGYVYTADSSAISDAEQNLADKQNALYNLGLDGANEYMQKYAETMQEAQDAITELTQMWMNGEIESEEEYQRRKAEIQEYYYDKLKQYSELYQIALTTDSNIVAEAWACDFKGMVVDVDNWKEKVAGEGGYFQKAEDAIKSWQDVCKEVAEDTGLDQVATAVSGVTEASKALKDTILGDGADNKGVIGAIMDEVTAAGELSKAYIGIQNEIDKVIEKYEELLKKINEDYTDPETPVVPPADPTEGGEAPEGGGGEAPEGGGGEEPPNYDATTKQGVALAIWNGNYGWGTGSTRKARLEEKGFNYDEIQGIVNNTNPNGNWRQRYGISDLGQYSYASFDTGGYTGEWDGQYGKFAMLHQKELVLNAGDTENFLAGMDLLNKIISAIDLYSANAQLGGMLASPSLGNVGTTETLEQQVHIEASFPNVQNRNEIEEAFNTLVNRASQYANRK